MYKRMHVTENSALKKIGITAIFLNLCFLALGQLTSTSSQTISSTTSYPGASTISSGSIVTISGVGTNVTFSSLTVGSGGTAGSLIIKNGVTVTVTGALTNSSYGTSASIIVQSGGTLIIKGGLNANGSTSNKALDIQSGGSVIITSGGLSFQGNDTINVAGSLQIRGGGLTMFNTSPVLNYSGSGNDTIIGSPAINNNTNSSSIIVGSAVNLYVGGNATISASSTFTINGNVSINGSFQGANNTSNVTGTGSITTTGSLDASGTGTTVFGSIVSCPTGPCSGRNTITSSNFTPCPSVSINLTGTNLGAVTYQWLSATALAGPYSNISGATAQNYTTSVTATTYFERQYTSGGTTYNGNIVTITPSVSNPTVVTGGPMSVCSGTTPDITVGTTTTNCGSVLWTTSGSGSFSNTTSQYYSTYTFSAADISAGSVTITLKGYATGGCSAVYVSSSFLLTVNKSPTIGTQPSTSTQSGCPASITALSVAATGGGLTYQWYSNASNSNSGGTIIAGATSTSYTPAIAGAKYYYCIVSGCSPSATSNVSGLITINSPSIVTQPSTSVQTGCPASITAINVAATGTVLTYQWYSNSSNSNAGGTIISGATLASYTPAVAGANYYYCIVSGSCTPAATSNTSGLITINAAPSIGTQPSPSAQTACPASITSISVAASGTSLTYQWYSNASNSNAGGTIISGATLANYTPAVAGAKYYYCIVSGTCTPVATSNTSGLITINAAPSIGTQPSTSVQTACPASITSINVAATGTSLTYQWYSNSSNSNAGGTIISGATLASYTPAVAGANYYYCIVSGSCTPAATSNTSGLITINTAPSIGTQPSPSAQTACPASITAISVAASGTSLTYQWYSNASNSNAGGTIISGATLANYTPAVAGANYYYCIVSGTCTPVATSNTSGLITINAAPSIGTQPSTSAQTACPASITSINVAATGTSLTYQWYSNSSNSNAGGTIISGATLVSYTPAVAGANYYYCIVSGTCTPAATSNVSGLITINAAPSICTQPSPSAQTACPASITSISVAASGTSLTYQWYSNASNSNAGGTIISGATLASYTPAVAGANYYYCIVSGTCTPAATSAVSGLITINPLVGAVGSITGSTTVCYGQTGVSYSISAVSNASSYTWSVPTGAVVTSGSGTTAIIVSYAGASVTSGTVSVTATNSCGSASNSVAVNINFGCSLTWTGASTTDWSTPANWSGSYVPTNLDNITIPVSPTRNPSLTTNVSIGSITNNGTLTLGNNTISLNGNLTNNGTITSISGSTLAFTGTSAQTLSGTSTTTLYGLKINNSSGGVSITSAVVVNGSISLVSGVLTTGSNLTIKFDIGGNIAYNVSDAGSISGNVTGTRTLIARSHYIAAPFSGVTAAQVQATTPLFVNPYWKMYSKNFTAQNWAAVTDVTTAMPLGTGFSLSLPSIAALTFTGTYNHAFAFSSALYSNVATPKYFLVGNPYPSTLDWDNGSGWTKTNIGGSIYYWDPATSKTASYVGGVSTNGGTRYVPAMQSFMVVCDGTGGSSSLSINNNARNSLQNPSYWRVASEDLIRIHLTAQDTILRDETVIRFNENASNKFDFELDAFKILNTGVNPSVYTRVGTQNCSINSYATVDSAKVIPLFAKLATDGTYTFNFENSNLNIQYVLHDKQLGVEQPITERYTFVGTSKDSVNRFQLELRESAITVTTGLQSANKARGLQINSSIKGFILQSDRFVGDAASIELADVTGNIVKRISNESITSNSTFVPVDLADGTYIVKVMIGSELFSGLIVLVK
jgi:hypothetical protein